MQLDLTDDQTQLRDSVRDVLSRECPLSVARQVVEGSGSWRNLWSTMVELDWPGLTVAEKAGGIGFGMVEAALVAEELGRALAPGPMLAVLGQTVPALSVAIGPAAARMGDVASGTLTASLAIAAQSGHIDTARPPVTARPDGGCWRLSGRAWWVSDATVVTHVAVAAGTDTGPGLFLVPVDADGASIVEIESFEQSRPTGHLDLDVVVATDDVLVAPSDAAVELIDRIVEAATVISAAEMVGVGDRALQTTLTYAAEREQFDRPIGSFQAIKHKLADMYVAVERARACTYFAALAVAEDDARRATATSVAKAAAGDMQRLVAKETIQIHGGIGYMWESDVQLLVKRLKAGELFWGGTHTHRARLADLLGV